MQTQVDTKRVALVTGGSKGIGFAIAKRLAERGIATIILAARNQSDLDTARKELMEKHGAKNVETISVDLAKPEGYTAIVSYIKEKHGKLNILVNNAGDFKQIPSTDANGNMRESPSEIANDVTSLFLVNAVPPSILQHALQPLMLEASHAVQLDVLSSAALEIFSGNNPYGPTKVAHERTSLSAVADSNGCICSYRVYPSNTDTRIVKHFSAPKMTPDDVGSRAVDMMLDDSGTDLYLKMASQGIVHAMFHVDYSAYVKESSSGDVTVDGLGLVSEHRALIRAVFEPVIRNVK